MADAQRIAELDQFFVQQKITPLVNKYRVASLGSDGQSEGDSLVEVQQKRLKIREEIEFKTADKDSVPMMRLKARSVMDFRGRSDVQLPDGTIIGQLQKVFGASLFRSTWELLSPEGEVIASAVESSMPIAILRRIWNMVPVVGEVPFMLPYHFDILIDGAKVGKYERQFSLSDRYVMDLRGDSERKIDRRVAIAWAIALDALQDR